MDVYLVRHGRTEMNRLGLLQGQSGFGLLPEGREDAVQAATALRGKRVTLIYSSDQQRARETAAILRDRLGVVPRVRLSLALRELDFGTMTGKPAPEVERICPAWKTDPDFVFPRGESTARVQERALDWFRRLLRRRPARAVAVVSHGAWIRCLLAALSGRSLKAALEGRVPHGLVARIRVGPSGVCRLDLLGAISLFR